MEDESGGEGLFNISTDPEDDSGFARILYNKDISLLEDPEKESDGRQSIKCFNCGGEHSLRDCKEPIDRNALAKNRAQFQRKNGNRPGGDFRRYHLQVEDESKDMGKAVPGIISDRLRDALGITEDQIPPYVYKMRILGYPPGWLEEAKTGHSGINMIDSKGERVPDPDDEEGEIVTTRPRYDLSKIIDYPGFNVWPHPNTINETDIYGVPQMSMDHSKAAFVQMLQDEMDSDDVVMEDSFITIDEAVARDGGDDEEEEEGECPRESPPPRLNDNERRISTEVVEPVPASHSTPKLKPEEANRASEEQLDFDSSFGRIKSVEMGTPALKIHSPYSLPPPEAFRKDITDVIFFENLPNATGKYENLKKLLKDVRSKIHTLKNTSEGN